MKKFSIEKMNISKRPGDNKEMCLCAYMGIERSNHDATRYDMHSDIEAGDMNISVKSDHSTLMSGTLCKGLTTVIDIWNLYASRVHSNTFAYISNDYTVYMMNLSEFHDMIMTFGVIESESGKNKGMKKVRIKHESKTMLKWLDARA